MEDAHALDTSLKTVVVKQGDYVARVAERAGLSPEEIWGHASNEELSAERGTPDCLLAGDVLRVPESPRAPLSFRVGEVNTYRASPQVVRIPAVFRHGGEPLANAEYDVIGLGDERRGVTDAEGRATIESTTHVDRIEVRFPSFKVAFVLKVGHLDPASSPTGVRQRLANLGYLPRLVGGRAGQPVRDVLPDESELRFFRAALRAFQRDHRLEATGDPNQETITKLTAVHGR